jgi:hypothetical protein
VLVTFVLAACGPASTSARPKATTPSATILPASPHPVGAGDLSADGLLPAWPQLHDRLVLKTTEVSAGTTSVSGTLVVVNDGRRAINLSRGCRPSYVVVLTSRTYEPTVAWAMVCSVRPFLMAPGRNRLPFSISTTYLSCGPPPNTPSDPPCLDHPMRPPPLPAGRYRAVLRGDGLALPPPPSVSITLTS